MIHQRALPCPRSEVIFNDLVTQLREQLRPFVGCVRVVCACASLPRDQEPIKMECLAWSNSLLYASVSARLWAYWKNKPLEVNGDSIITYMYPSCMRSYAVKMIDKTQSRLNARITQKLEELCYLIYCEYKWLCHMSIPYTYNAN